MRGSSPAPRRRGLRWTEEEDKKLLWWWGQTHVELLAKRMHRGMGALIARARKLGLGGWAGVDSISLYELARRAGRDIDVVRRVALRLNIKLRVKARTRPRSARNPRRLPWYARRYAIPVADAQRVLDVLKPLAGTDTLTAKALGDWSLKYPCCIRCGKTDSAYKRLGMCSRCAKHVEDVKILRAIPDQYDGYVRLSVLGHECGKKTASVLLAAKMAGVEVLRAKRVYYATLEAAEKIRAVLAKGGRLTPNPYTKWGVGGRPAACRLCSRSDRPHGARGYCVACYEWLRRRGRHAA